MYKLIPVALHVRFSAFLGENLVGTFSLFGAPPQVEHAY